MLPFLAGLVALALLTAPGAWLAHRRALPLPVLAGFLLGSAALCTGMLALQLAGAPLTLAALAGLWLTATALIVRLERRPPGISAPPPATPTLNAQPSTLNFSSLDAQLLLPLLRPFPLLALIPLLAVLAWRATAHPLFGVDTGFRWNLLAGQMLAQHSLDFYPPHRDADFLLYVWPDGIPPLVSSLYFSAYALLGRAARAATAPLVLAQFLLLLAATAALARRYFSARAAVFAVALLAVTPLAGWAATMGHETGFTALSLVALLLYLPRNRAEETPAALLAAGLAAAVGALAREYGWAFVAFGFALALTRRLSPRALASFLAPALLLALPWYARNAILTGNPLFNHALAGLFPVNAAHERLMLIYRDVYRFLPQLLEHPTVLLENNFAVLLAGALGAALFFRRAPAFVFSAVLVVALWLLSIRDTAAGLANSLRVLAPACAVLAVLGGAACERLLPPARRALTLILFAALALDAALRALTLPNNTYRLAPARWLDVDAYTAAYEDRPIYHELARLTAGTRVLALGPNVYLAPLGMDVISPWAPSVSFLFDASLSPAAARARLYATGVRYLLVAKSTTNQTYLAAAPAFADATAAELVPVLDRDNLILFALAPP